MKADAVREFVGTCLAKLMGQYLCDAMIETEWCRYLKSEKFNLKAFTLCEDSIAKNADQIHSTCAMKPISLELGIQ